MVTLGLWLTFWIASGLVAGAVAARLGYDRARWLALGAALGPVALPVWALRRTRVPASSEVVEDGWPPQTAVDLLVVPTRGPTPALVRAVAARGRHARRVAIARVVAYDARRRDLDQARVQLRGDRGALGLPRAELVVLFGGLERAVVGHAVGAGIREVLVDSELRDPTGTVRIIRCVDVDAVERPQTVRVLGAAPPQEDKDGRWDRPGAGPRHVRRGPTRSA